MGIIKTVRFSWEDFYCLTSVAQASSQRREVSKWGLEYFGVNYPFKMLTYSLEKVLTFGNVLLTVEMNIKINKCFTSVVHC